MNIQRLSAIPGIVRDTNAPPDKPGLVVLADLNSQEIAHRITITEGLEASKASRPRHGMFFIPPGVVKWLEEHKTEMSVFKQIAKLVAGQIHRTGPALIDCVWLVIDGIPLTSKLQDPEADWVACAIDVVKWGSGAVSAAGDLGALPECVTLSEDWKKGLGFMVKMADGVYHGKDPQAMQMDYLMGLTKELDLAWSVGKLISAAASEKADYENVRFQHTAIDLTGIARYGKLLSPAGALADQLSDIPMSRGGTLSASRQSDTGTVEGTAMGSASDRNRN